ncbi:hypothetical protein BGZ82_009878 [Podila clonocystis]|nr:hypothetical protein BGZ82_009878 [Podila clonocystis]
MNSNLEGQYERIAVQVEELRERSGAKEDTPTTNEHGNGQNSEPMTKTTPSITPKKDNKPQANKKTRSQKSKNAKEKGKNNKPQKSRLERKLGQLIPALDENGVIIEDHFISPRDSDGDGIPDYYVLLRPSTNRYMMDVGLFDEDVVVPPAPAVLSSVILSSQPTAIPAVDFVVDPVVPVSPMEAPPPAATPPPPPPAPSVA